VKSSLLTILGIGLPLTLMMVLWQYLASPPETTGPSGLAEHTVAKHSPDADPTALRLFQTPPQSPASRPADATLTFTEAAESWLDQLEAAVRRNEDVQRTTAGLLLRQRRFAAAAEAFDRLLVRAADDPALLTGKAMALSGLDRHDDALPLLASVVRLDSASPVAHFNHAVVLMRAGQREEAVQALTSVLTLQPRHAKAMFNLAILDQASGRWADALARWRRLTDGDPGSQPTEAQNALDSPDETAVLATSLTPRMLADAWFHRGEAAVELKQPAEAEVCFMNVVRLEPRSAIGWCNVGIARADQVRRSDALTALQIALQLDPKLVPALNQAAYIHAALFHDLGDVEHGRKVAEYCRESLRIKPDQPNVTELLRAARQFDRSERMAAEAGMGSG
jgi:tetratricopeptide (TPR) repeat protein